MAGKADFDMTPGMGEAARLACKLAGAAERVSVELMFLAVFDVDRRIVELLLRNSRIAVPELAERIRRAVASVPGAGDIAQILAIYDGEDLIGPYQFLGALLLHGENGVCDELRRAGVDPRRLLRQRFREFHRFRTNGSTGFRSPETKAEHRARLWLSALVPHQADRYKTLGTLEADSTVFPSMRYRIRRTGVTQLIDGDTTVARICLRILAPVPETDRVIAEYVLIRGSESQYLQRANVIWSKGGDPRDAYRGNVPPRPRRPEMRPRLSARTAPRGAGAISGAHEAGVHGVRRCLRQTIT